MKRIVSLLIFACLIFLFACPIKAPTEEAHVKVFSGVVPHHLLAKDIIEDFYLKLSNKAKPETIILLSPDHFHQCEINETDLIMPESPVIQDINIDIEGISELKQALSILQDDSTVFLDHGVMNHFPYIKKYFPEVSLIPMVVSQNLTEDNAKSITEWIFDNLKSETIIIASVDFSHYLPKEIAAIHDIKSKRVLMNFETEQFENIEVDSWQSLYIARYFSELQGINSYTLIAEKNSNDYFPDERLSETTSYFSIIFGDNLEQHLTKIEDRTLAFVGDIMLDRNVEKLMTEKGLIYPFEEIKSILKGFDYTVGNLEGIISENKQPYETNSLMFSFRKEAAQILKESHFNIMNLANNHSLNFGNKALNFTRTILNKAEVSSFGDPLNFTDKYILKNENFVFLGFNLTYGYVQQNLIDAIAKVSNENANAFVILYLHWGNEYEEKSSPSQRELAHALIDRGVDLIIGSHPHVVQEIEKYHSGIRNKDALIFYSLGNFVFDQYFSKETQEGLMVGFTKSTGSLQFTLIPVKLTNSQPQLMAQEEKSDFLSNLARKSSEELRKQIEKGEIDLNN